MNAKFLKKADYQNLADLHLKAFSSFFLSSLGKSFLTLFCKSIIKHSEGIDVRLFNKSKACHKV